MYVCMYAAEGDGNSGKPIASILHGSPKDTSAGVSSKCLRDPKFPLPLFVLWVLLLEVRVGLVVVGDVGWLAHMCGSFWAECSKH